MDIRGEREGVDEAMVNLLDYFRTQALPDFFIQKLQECADGICYDRIGVKCFDDCNEDGLEIWKR